jgi:hypothetical protein
MHVVMFVIDERIQRKRNDLENEIAPKRRTII